LQLQAIWRMVGHMASSKVGSLGEYIREQRQRAKISVRQLAEAAGVSNPYLSQIERGLRKPSAEILQQIAKGLRISAEVLYVQAGILEDREADTDVQAAIRADLLITERQKQVLLDIYLSFVKENEAAGIGPLQGVVEEDAQQKDSLRKDVRKDEFE
jgi:transcriptional regulator with XRE-family HTH domain